MLTLIRNRNFMLLWAGGFVSQIGDWALMVALPMYVYRITGSTLATAAAGIAEILPSLVFGAIAGVFVDRWDRRKTIIGANVLLGIGLLPLLAVHASSLIWIVYAVAFFQSVTTQFLFPAWNALLPLLVPEEDLVSANSLRSLNSNVARLVGPAIGGLAAAVGSLGAAALIDSASFLVVAILAALVTGISTTPRTEPASDSGGIRSFVTQLQAGFHVVRANRMVAALVTSYSIFSLGEGMMGVMFVVWVRQVLHGGSPQLGWFMSAQAVGGILGGLVIAHLGKKLSPAPVYAIAAIVFGAMDIMLFSYPLVLHGIWLGLVIICVVGLPAAAVGATFTTLLQTSTDDAHRGRIFGLMGATSGASALVGTILAGVLGSYFGSIVLLNVFQGGAYLLAGTVALGMLGRELVSPQKHAVPAAPPAR